MPDPFLIFEMLQAHQRTAALQAGIELGLFGALGEGPADAAMLAAKCGASERGTRVLADYLTIAGLLTKQDGVYSNSEVSGTFLDPKSPACLASIAKFLGNKEMVETCKGLTQIVRQGRTNLPGQGTVEPENPMWVEFAESMAPIMRATAPMVAGVALQGTTGPVKVLDIAAGHGLFGLGIAQQNPEAQIVAVDWAQVLDVAKKNAAAAGISLQTIEGDAFTVDYGSGYDIVLLTNFLHHFDHATNVKLLRKVHAALKPGGRAVTLEFIPNDDRVTPPEAATFSLTMLLSTASGDAYPFSELSAMHKEAGFGEVTHHKLPFGAESVVVAIRTGSEF